MNEVFSPQRLRLLIWGDLVAGYRSLLVVSSALAGVILVAALATHGGAPHDGDFYRRCFGLALFVWGLVASSRAFRPLHDRTRNEAYLLIPASALEKTLARLLAVTVGLVAYLLVFIGLVSVVVDTLNLVLYGDRHAFFDPFDRTVWSSIFVYIILQSFYFLGGAWFRRAHFVKTTLALTLAVAGFALLRRGHGTNRLRGLLAGCRGRVLRSGAARTGARERNGSRRSRDHAPAAARLLVDRMASRGRGPGQRWSLASPRASICKSRTRSANGSSMAIGGAGERIPSIRELAVELGVNPNTVTKSYQRLMDRGIISRPKRSWLLRGRRRPRAGIAGDEGGVPA